MSLTEKEQEQLDFMKALLTVRGNGDQQVEDKIDQHLHVLIDIMERKDKPWLKLVVKKRS